MREIKFRVWSNTSKQYLDSEDYQVSCDDGDIYESVAVSYIHNLSAGIVITHNLILEQYTGLLDCKGKEIYEGDKIRYVHESDTYLDEELNMITDDWSESTIVWGNDYPAFDVENHSEDYNLLSSPEYIIEVVGNIHTSKEAQTSPKDDLQEGEK